MTRDTGANYFERNKNNTGRLLCGQQAGSSNIDDDLLLLLLLLRLPRWLAAR